MNIAERLTTGFYNWEKRGRGRYYFDQPVQLEPPFIPFSHADNLPVERQPQVDDGRIASFFSSVVSSVQNIFSYNKVVQPGPEEHIYPVEPYPAPISESPVELQLTIPVGLEATLQNTHELLLMFSSSQFPLSFEIIGTERSIIVQIVCDESEEVHVLSNIHAFLPGIIISKQDRYIDSVWSTGRYMDIRYATLSEEFMRPLQCDLKSSIDPLTGLYAVLEQLGEGEAVILQVLFQGTLNAWSRSVLNSVSDFEGKPFFLDDPLMLPLTKEKISSPLFAASVRFVVQSGSEYRNSQLMQGLFNSLGGVARVESNMLVLLKVDLTEEERSVDIIMRTSHVLGMLLNSLELVNLVHLPFKNVVSSKLAGQIKKTKALSPEHIGHTYELGTNTHYGTTRTISLSHEERLKHIHIIGATGSGKSNLMKNFIVQDIKAGQAIAVLDPHGDLIEECLAYIPEERIKDVILIDPFDSEYPIGFNLLSAQTDIEKMVLSSDLISIFKRQATSCGDQMTAVLSQAINAFLEHSRGGTLVDLRRFLVDKSFRAEYIKGIQDEATQYFWQHEFPLLRNNSIAPITTRLDTFLRPKVIRHMMAQQKGLDFNEIINSNKLLLIKLSQGLIGEQNSFLLGTLFIAKLNQAAQARQLQDKAQRLPFYLYVDEFQNFITDSLSSILSGARKYGLGLVLAHQDLEQVNARDNEVAHSILANPYTRICFRCGDADAQKLATGFSYFDAFDLQNLRVGEAIVRIGARDHDGNISTSILSKPADEVIRERVVAHTRDSYSNPIVEHSPEPIEEIREPVREAPEIKEPEPITEPTSALEAEPFEQKQQNFIAQVEKEQAIRQHQYLQQYMKKTAEGLGFKATLEEPTANGGRVDVALTYVGLRIAIEISVTNTPEYEVQNIKKCFDAHYSAIYMISEETKHLLAIRELALATLNAPIMEHVFFTTKEACIEQLQQLIAKQQQPTTLQIKGYRVKVSHSLADTGYQASFLANSVHSAMKK